MGEAISMEELALGAAHGDLVAFQQRYGDGFLLYTGRAEQLKQAKREWQPTLDSQGRKVGASAPERLTSILAYPLRSTNTPWSVTIGRVAPNDVAIPDESVSIYHAVLTRGRDGRFWLQDAGSKNGTYVNEALVSSEDERGAEVRPSNMLRFGSVVLTFLLPAEVFDLARTLGAVTATTPAVPAVRPAAAAPAPALFDDLTPTMSGSRPLSDHLLTYFDAIQCVQQKHYAAAQEILRELLAQDPRDRNVLLWLRLAEARQRLQSGDWAGADACYHAVLEIDPAHEEALSERRRLRQRLKPTR